MAVLSETRISVQSSAVRPYDHLAIYDCFLLNSPLKEGARSENISTYLIPFSVISWIVIESFYFIAAARMLIA